MNEKIKAVALLSGGLDSLLAVKIIQEVNPDIKIYGIFIKTPFLKPKWVIKAVSFLNIPLEIVQAKEDYIEIIKNPEFGYGQAVNPCIDCHIYFLKKAKEYMEKIGAKFIITGEVVGQRPMSQRKEILKLIEKKAGVEKLVLRPLSAKLLPKTIPEIKGWVDRKKLYAISGRGRKLQFELAKKYNIKEFSSPAGGCLLTDKQFAKRFNDALKYNELDYEMARLLKIGRHFRLPQKSKLIVSRNEGENRIIAKFKENQNNFYVLEVSNYTRSPLGLLLLKGKEDIILASSIVLTYSDLKSNEWKIDIWQEGKILQSIYVQKMTKKEVSKWRL